MPKVKKVTGVTHFRWVAPDFVSDKPFRVITDTREIAYWEKRFERWKDELDRMPKNQERRRAVIQYHQFVRTSLRTMLIEEPL